MKLPKKGEKGFTLIELLIVVAILGVLAAVVIPNVGRFIGRGEDEAAETEFANVQSAVLAMMVDVGIETLPSPQTTATNQMDNFPDTTANDLYVLFGNNSTGANYIVTINATGTYTANGQGVVVQATTGY